MKFYTPELVARRRAIRTDEEFDAAQEEMDRVQELYAGHLKAIDTNLQAAAATLVLDNYSLADSRLVGIWHTPTLGVVVVLDFDRYSLLLEYGQSGLSGGYTVTRHPTIYKESGANFVLADEWSSGLDNTLTHTILTSGLEFAIQLTTVNSVDRRLGKNVTWPALSLVSS